jgi:hypothetical protein
LMPVLVVPVTVGFSDVDCPPVNVVEVGFSATPMVGTNAIVAVADLVGSTWLVAVNVMFS